MKYETTMHFYLEMNQIFYHVLCPFAKSGRRVVEESDVHT